MRINEYIGQENIKERISYLIKASIIQKTPLPHVLMAGPPGTGKTTLAKIIAEELGAPFYRYFAANIDSEKAIISMFGKLSKQGYGLLTGGNIIDRNEIIHSVIFIDEIHNLKPRITEMLHTVLENREITINMADPVSHRIGPTLCWVPEFTMIGATNYLGSLPKPFRDRFTTTLTFEIYSDDEIKVIITNEAHRRKTNIEIDAVNEIAKRSRGVPRIAISFLKKTIDLAVSETNSWPKMIRKDHADRMFEIDMIDDLGLTNQDRKALNYLIRTNRPIGLKSFAQAIDEDCQTVENVIEPYLVRLGFIVRTGSGRYLTDEGQSYLNKERELSLYPVEVT